MKKRMRVYAVLIIAVMLVVLCGNVQALGASYLKIVGSSPDNYSSIIDISNDIVINFDRNIKKGSRFDNITLKNANNKVVPITCNINNTTLSISPDQSLDYGSYYILTIPYNGVEDDVGVNLYQDFTLVFVTQGDYIPPEIDSTEPVDYTENADINTLIKIKFTEKIKAGKAIEGISLQHGNNLKAPIYVGINGDTLIIKPLEKLMYNTTYFVYLPYNSVTDIAGNSNYYAFPVIFTTKQEEKELKIIDSNPSNNAKYINIDRPIRIFYNEEIVGDKGLENIKVSDSKGSIPIIPSISGNVLSIRPKNSLNFAYNTTYTVNVPIEAAKGVSGAAAKKAYTFSFTTEEQLQSPKITDAAPQNGAEGVSVNSTLKVTFSENIKQGNTIFNIILKDEKGNEIKTDLSISNNVLNIRPKVELQYNTEYTYTIPYGAVSNYNNIPLKQDYEFKFKTDIERFTPYIVKSYPVEGASNTTVDGGITIIFSEEIQKGSNFDYISLRDVYYNELPIVKEVTGKTIRIVPVNNLNLAYNTKYMVTIPYGAVKDGFDNQLAYSRTISFTTGFERFSPIIKMVSPRDASIDKKTDTAIEITYSDKMLKGDNFSDIVLKDDRNNNIKFTADVVEDKVVIKPQNSLENNTSYTLFVPVGGFKDYWNGTARENFTLKFKTEKETVPPVVKSVAPVNGSRNIGLDSSIIIEFNENIAGGKLFKKIVLTNGNMKNIPYTSEIKDKKLIIKPVKPLEELTSYTLRVPLDAVTDKSENTLKEEVLLNFITKAGEATKAALGVNDVKINGSSNALAITFNRDVVYGSSIKRVMLKDEKGKSVLLRFGIKGSTLTLTPGVKLTKGLRYVLTIPAAGIRDKQGKNMVKQFSYSFIAK